SASPFVYEQLSRVALELENEKLAIQMLQRGFQLHAKMPARRQNDLMSLDRDLRGHEIAKQQILGERPSRRLQLDWLSQDH
ncbi:MAG: hypothetical protein P8M20_00540, partial [Planctomycetaceae bacterium]|nr:hypothetical protein [Planctomycetaceae bacterium]